MKIKYIIVLVIILFLISVGYIFYLLKKETKPTPSIPTTIQNSYKALTPGTTDEKEVVATLGKPLTENTQGKETVLTYPSNSPARKDRVIIENNKVKIIKEVVTLKDSKKVSSLTKTYGTAPYSLFGPDAQSGFYLYIYPDKGLAFIGNVPADLLTEIWYFTPTSIEQFTTDFAQGYSKEMKIQQ
jgi:hypothetical protein